MSELAKTRKILRGLYEELVPEETQDNNTLELEPKGIEGRTTIKIKLKDEHIYKASSEKGHGHLLVRAELTTTEYWAVMGLLAHAKVIGIKYLGFSALRGYSAVRFFNHYKD